MSDTDKSQFFPEKYKAKMRQDSQMFASGARLDSLSWSPVALQFLQAVAPDLCWAIQSGNTRQLRNDASESMFFARQLEFIRPGLLEVLFPDLEGKQWVPMENSIGVGAEQYTYRWMEKKGRAQLLKSYSDTMPRTDVIGGETTVTIRSMGDMYGYSMQELRAAMQAQLPLDVRKAMSARYAIALLQDEVIFYGNADLVAEQDTTNGLDAGALNGGMKGLATLSNTTSFTTPSVSGSQLWHDKSPDDIVFDLSSFVNNVVTTTKGIHRPDTMLLPLAAYNQAASKRMGDGSNQTILDFFLKTSPYIKNIFPTYRLDAAQAKNWALTTGRAICYERTPERLVAGIPLEFESLTPFQKHLEIETACHGRTMGVVPYYPKSLSYMDGITDTTDA